MTACDPPEYQKPEWVPTRHPFEPDPYTDGYSCLVCGFDRAFGQLHPQPLTEVPDITGPAAAEDTVPWESIPCPVCKREGPCVGDYGYLLRPHRQRIEAARGRHDGAEGR